MFCEVLGPEKEIGGVKIAKDFSSSGSRQKAKSPHRRRWMFSWGGRIEAAAGSPRILNAGSPLGHVIGLEIISRNLQKQITWQGLGSANSFSLADGSKAVGRVTPLGCF